MSLLVISEPWNNEKINLMKKHLSDLQATTLFYISMPSGNHTDVTWHQIISLNSGSALSNLKFVESSSRIFETFDMHGLEITSSALTWAPYLTIDDCNEHGLECANNYGYLIDFMDKLTVQFNFTYDSQKNVNDSWWHLGAHGIYGGVLGDVQSKEYDMSLSPWTWLLSRHESFDFVPFIKDGYILAFIPKKSNDDFGLVTRRVFVGGAWTSLLCISGAILFVIVLTNIYCITEAMNGIKILTFIWWLFFTLVYSYFCGVLTMFFATPAPILFETMRDVLQAYPDWKVVLLEGAEAGVIERAKGGDPDYISIWQQYKDISTETIFYSIENGLDLIENGQNVMLVDQNQLFGHIKSHSSNQSIHVINVRDLGLGCILFQKNSPLLPMFNQGVRYLRETGLERQLFYKWFGGLDKQNGATHSEVHTLTLWEVVTFLILMLVSFVVAPIVLCGELTFKQFCNRLTIRGQRGDAK